MLDVSQLGHRYGGPNGHLAIDELNFQVRDGELACIVGPSGCGKSTLLRTVSGLLPASHGDVRLRGAPVDGVPSDLAVVFQDYSRSLFPWLSVQSNVEFPLRARGMGKAQRRERAREVLDWVGLVDSARKYPWQLSDVAYVFNIDAALTKQLLGVGFLEIAGPDFFGGNMGGDCKDRNTRTLGVIEPVNEVQVARSSGTCRDREFTGHRGFGRGCKSSGFLMSNVHPIDV